MSRACAALTLVLSLVSSLPAQNALAGLPNLIANGGFEDGTKGWRVTIGPYGQGDDPWSAAKGVAEVVSQDAFAGDHCLRLDARAQPAEVDVTADRVGVESGRVYLLSARVRQLAGDGGYKVTVDWLDAAGKHLRYDNDWRGNDHPKSYTNHGGVFVAPEQAAYAVIILGVSKGGACLIDEVRLSALPVPAAAPAPDGEGQATVALPARVEAGGYGTFRLTYHAGPHGLPVGGVIEFRRSNVDPRWSPLQTTDPKAAGFTTVKASNGAMCLVQPGGELQVPSVTRVALLYPALAPGDTLDIVYGDTSGGGPGAQVQPKAEPGVGFRLAMGGHDGSVLDLADPPGACDIVPGPAAQLGLITPVVAEVGKPFTVSLEARDRNGNVVPDYLAAARVGAVDATFTAADHGRHRATVTLDAPGERVLEASTGAVQAEQTIIVIKPLPDLGPPLAAGVRTRAVGDVYVLENRFVRLILPRTDAGYGVGLLEANVGGTWRRAGTIRAMGELWTGAAGQPSTKSPIWLRSVLVHGDDHSTAVAMRRDFEAGGSWSATVHCGLDAEARHVSILCHVMPRVDTQLRAFYGPVYYAGDGAFGARKDGALFPGLEYLTGNEVSSGDYGIVPPYSDRLVPNPLKITMPLMAVAADGLCTMAFWNPEQSWGQGPSAAHSAACFDSPARREDRDGHLFTLFGPSPREGLAENARELPAPMAIAADAQSLTQEVSLAALPGDDVTAGVRYWFDVNGVPDPPPAPRSWAEESRLNARGLSQIAWDPAKKGWHNALDDPWGAAYNPAVALVLHHFTRANPTDPLTPAITAELAEAWAAVGNQRGFDEAFTFGDAAAAVNDLLDSGLRQAFGMAADGSYGFHPTTGNKQISQAQSRSLGRDGEVNVGTCVMSLEPLMRAALFTGEPLLVQAGEKGLACLDRFSRPQGAENWEVPLACPNLRAAALATRCYLYGYELTGKPAYLARARYWAGTGLPFLYVWNAADRPVMRYASISVMGTSLHTGLWFGNAVQWVGLVYADAVRELAPYDTGFPWAKIAEGLLISAAQQQKTDASPRRHVGFFPDSYSPVKGDETYAWDLPPTAIELLAQSLHGSSPAASATVLRLPDGRTVHVIAPGTITDASFEGGTLRFTSHYLPGEPHEIVIARVARAEQVTADGAVLPKSDWQPTAWGSLRLRVRPAGEAARIEITGCEPAPVSLDLGRIANGDFEQGLVYWSPGPPERVHLVGDAHGGKQAVELDGVVAAGEVQCTSRPMRVKAGQVYELASWVKQTAGDGDYKVTVDWSGAAGHVKYDNDWAGSNRPAVYTLHGGRFTAPAGAESAVIILGVRGGSRCRFDDVALTPVP
jgi:hypothetical protein